MKKFLLLSMVVVCTDSFGSYHVKPLLDEKDFAALDTKEAPEESSRKREATKVIDPDQLEQLLRQLEKMPKSRRLEEVANVKGEEAGNRFVTNSPVRGRSKSTSRIAPPNSSLGLLNALRKRAKSPRVDQSSSGVLEETLPEGVDGKARELLLGSSKEAIARKEKTSAVLGEAVWKSSQITVTESDLESFLESLPEDVGDKVRQYLQGSSVLDAEKEEELPTKKIPVTTDKLSRASEGSPGGRQFLLASQRRKSPRKVPASADVFAEQPKHKPLPVPPDKAKKNVIPQHMKQERKRSHTSPPIPSWVHEEGDEKEDSQILSLSSNDMTVQQRDPEEDSTEIMNSEMFRFLEGDQVELFEEKEESELEFIEEFRPISVAVCFEQHKDDEWVKTTYRQFFVDENWHSMFKRFMLSEYFEGVVAACLSDSSEACWLDEELLELAKKQFARWLIRSMKLSKASPRSWQVVKPSPEVTRNKKPRDYDRTGNGEQTGSVDEKLLY